MHIVQEATTELRRRLREAMQNGSVPKDVRFKFDKRSTGKPNEFAFYLIDEHGKKIEATDEVIGTVTMGDYSDIQIAAAPTTA